MCIITNSSLLYYFRTYFPPSSSMNGHALTLWPYGRTGAAVVMGILAVTGTAHCLIAGRVLRKYRYIEKTAL